MPAVGAGRYGVRFFSGSELKGQGFIDWDGTTEVTGATLEADIDAISGDATAANQLTIINAISALNDFDPASDVVANVTLVDTVTTNTDMRGTDGANTIAPDNASIAAILADTNDLQTNQGNFATATGFATTADIAGLNDLSAADVTSAVPTAAQIATAVEAAILNEGDGQQVIDAIVQAIGNENVTAATIAAAVWSAAARTLTGTTDANIVEITGQPISGSGTKADPWGP